MIRKTNRYEISVINDHGARVRLTTIRARNTAHVLKKVVKKLKKRKMGTALQLVRESGRARQI